MAPYSSTLAWEIPWMEEPGKLQSMGLQRVVSNSLRPHGLYCPWNSPGQNTRVGSLSLLHRIFLTQELNWSLLHLLPVDSLPAEPQEKSSVWLVYCKYTKMKQGDQLGDFQNNRDDRQWEFGPR